MLASNKYVEYNVQYCVRKKDIVWTKISFVRFLDCIDNHQWLYQNFESISHLC